MTSSERSFPESHFGSMPIRDLGLKIEGSALQPVIQEFAAELTKAGLTRVQPRYYLSTEWGVPFGTSAIAIPLYLAHPDFTALHSQRTGFVEGIGRAEILKYLRHEMGHVINYAYRLFDDEEWVKHFGSMTQPYPEEYHPAPFSRRFVRHLPGWYAQKHPDEDWAETFAVWMTPGLDWQAEYSDWPEALAKLRYCDREMASLKDREPVILGVDLDEDVSEIAFTAEQFYSGLATEDGALPPGLDGALRAIFEDVGFHEDFTTDAPRQPASALIRKVQNELLASVYRWTGHFPERTHRLLRHLIKRADELKQVYPSDRECQVAVALTALITALAMNHVHHGTYLKE